MDTLNFDNELHFNEFPPISLEEWEEVIRDDLKGKNYKETLRWSPDNNLFFLPFYRREHLEELSRTAKPVNYSRNWDLVELIENPDLKEANKDALNALKNGASGLNFNLPLNSIHTLSDLEQLLSDIWIEFISLHFGPALSSPEIGELFSELCENRKLNKNDLRVYFCYDPFSMATSTGHLQQKEAIKKQISSLASCAVDTSVYGNSGADIIQQLAFALAAGNELLGLDKNFVNYLYFKFVAGSTYFPEIAKFRAFRLLWNKVRTEYRLDTSPVPIHAETALWNKAEIDAHNNILRTTGEAMSAAIGGCNSISVLPYNYHFDKPAEFSNRIARNIQLILQEEAYFDKVADPGAGSYYIEVLTEEIAKKSWELFQEIETKGGFYECLKSGFIQDEIQKSREEKIQNYKDKKETLVGVNKYQPNEKIQNSKLKTQNFKSFEFTTDSFLEIKKIERLNIEAELQKGDA